MAIREPRLSVMNTSANPLMILGIFMFVAPFLLNIVAEPNGLVTGILSGLGILFFVVGLVVYFAENS